MQPKELLNCLKEFLTEQKIQHKMSLGGNSILFKMADSTFEIIPNQPMVSGTVLARFINVNAIDNKEWGEIWGQVTQRYTTDPTYDDWFWQSIGAIFPNNVQPPTARVLLLYKFETDEDLTALFKDPESFKGLCDKFTTVYNHVEESNKNWSL